MGYPFDAQLRPVKAPLTAAQRIMRGMRRLSLIIGTIILVIGLTLVAFVAFGAEPVNRFAAIFLTLVPTIIASAAGYGAPLLLGWIITGFTRD